MAYSSNRIPSVEDLISNPLPYIVSLIAIVFGLLGFLQPQFFIFPDNTHYTVWMWVVAMGIYWLNQIRGSKSYRTKSPSVFMFIISILSGGYILLNYHTLRVVRIGIYNNVDLIVGATIIAITLIAAYREYGIALPAVGLLTLAYGFFGQYFPGIFNYAGLGLRTISLSTVQLSGIFGFVSQAGTRWIFIFLIYAGMIQAFGGLDLFMQLGTRAATLVSSGVTQTAVLSSLIIGSISGSAAANTALTGSMTIPTMKEEGIPGEIAGAIESIASSGGQIMPPVMGIVAFVMANLLQTTYAHIIIIAALPGVIFYTTVAISVHLVSSKVANEKDISLRIDSLDEVERIEIIPRRQLAIKSIPFLLSFSYLVGVLLIYQLNAARAAFGALVVLILAKIVSATIIAYLSSDNWTTALTETASDFFEGIRQGTMTMVPIAIMLGVLGMIVNIFRTTGVGFKASLLLLNVADSSLIVFLILLMALVIILGMGMPTIGAYLLTITVAVPPLTKAGFPAVSAHFFVLYAAVISNYTPPVALTVAVASNIAKSDFLKTGIEAVKLGIPGFILPFVFVLSPSLLILQFPQTIFVFVGTILGLIGISIGVQNYGINGPVSRKTRAMYAISGILIIILTIVL